MLGKRSNFFYVQEVDSGKCTMWKTDNLSWRRLETNINLIVSVALRIIDSDARIKVPVIGESKGAPRTSTPLVQFFVYFISFRGEMGWHLPPVWEILDPPLTVGWLQDILDFPKI